MCVRAQSGLGKLGRPRARGRDEVGNDARTLGIRSWWATVGGNSLWADFVFFFNFDFVDPGWCRN